MNNNSGWIKLYRIFTNNHLWKENRTFSKAEAWLDVLMRVNYIHGENQIGMKAIEVKPGQLVTTQKALAKAWKWSRRKVGRFLSMLEKKGMVDVKAHTKYTLIDVVNWDLYQSGVDQTPTKRPSNAHRAMFPLKKQRKKESTTKKERNKKSTPFRINGRREEGLNVRAREEISGEGKKKKFSAKKENESGGMFADPVGKKLAAVWKKHWREEHGTEFHIDATVHNRFFTPINAWTFKKLYEQRQTEDGLTQDITPTEQAQIFDDLLELIPPWVKDRGYFKLSFISKRLEELATEAKNLYDKGNHPKNYEYQQKANKRSSDISIEELFG